MTSSPDPTGPLPSNANHQTGPVNAPTVQAGTINGDVHFHAVPPPPVNTPEPLNSPERTEPFTRESFMGLPGPAATGVVLGWIVDSVVGHHALIIHLFGDATMLAAVFLVLFILTKFTPVTIDGVVERCVPRAWATMSTAGLWWWLLTLTTLTWPWIDLSSLFLAGDPSSRNTNKLLMAFFVLIIMVVALLVRRRRH